jgi:hypothetical protein
MTDVSRLVSPEEFAAAMTRRWLSLGNTPSLKLQQLWAAMATTFARAIADNHAGGNKCRVLEPPTGTGKTQGLCVYAALSIDRNRNATAPLGILVVTRTIAQADDIVATIKELVSDPADADRVRARHSEAKQTPLAMRAADVLVITHEAYTRALEGLYKEQIGRWEDYTTWAHGPRRLTIIDEALSGAVEENQVKADDIRFALGFIGPAAQESIPQAGGGAQAGVRGARSDRRLQLGQERGVRGAGYLERGPRWPHLPRSLSHGAASGGDEEHPLRPHCVEQRQSRGPSAHCRQGGPNAQGL